MASRIELGKFSCRHCSSTSHLIYDCPDIRCKKCNEKGHYAKNCQMEAISIADQIKERLTKTATTAAIKKSQAICNRCYGWGHNAQVCHSQIWCKHCDTKDDHHSRNCEEKK